MKTTVKATMRTTAGLTLLEVIIAIVVLAVGVLAAAAMQTNALRSTNEARAVQNVTEFAEREIELRRQFDLSSPTGTSPTCTSVATVPTGYNCAVVVRACELAGTTASPTLSCPITGITTPPVADQVTVTVTGPREKSIVLKTVKARS